MKLGATRQLEGLRPVLKDPQSIGPDPVYWVFYEVTDEKWANTTITAPGRIGDEYPKTFGHYHPADAPVENYHVVEGEGVMLLQQKKFENGEWLKDQVGAVYLVKAKAGDDIAISNEWGHSFTNTGDLPLITFDDWRSGHTPEDYAIIETQQGMAYYLINEDNKPTAIPNPNYQNLPEAQWVTADEYRLLQEK